MSDHLLEGISLIKLTKMFPDEETAKKWIEDIRWPDARSVPTAGARTSSIPSSTRP